MYQISEYMNDYGKMSVKYVFGALALLNLFLAILLLICCFSGHHVLMVVVDVYINYDFI